jgi:hypothetical protein
MEVIVALGVVAFALLTMIGVYASSIRLMVRGEELTRASELGRSILEGINQAGYSSLPAPGTVFDGRSSDPAVDGFPPLPYPGTPDYPMVLETEQLDTDLRSVTVKVYYSEENHITLQTYMRPQ